MAYYLCAKKQNLRFLSKLLESPTKTIKIEIKKVVDVEPLENLKKHYFLLNSSEKDSLPTIRKRYFALAKTYHPDRVVHKNKNLVEAYEVLKYEIAS